MVLGELLNVFIDLFIFQNRPLCISQKTEKKK